jgi:DNA invertase Pin-like site-specific DNA recombinase
MAQVSAALYARVSTVDQKCEMQIRELKEDLARRGWDPWMYVDMESTRKRRPELERLLADAAAGKLHCVVVWKLDRFGRSVQELCANIAALDRAGVRFLVPSQGIDTDKRNPTSRLLLHVLAAIAEFERDLIQERVASGIKRYREDFAAGKVGKAVHSRSGKDLPVGNQHAVFDREKARKLRRAGLTIRVIAWKLKVPKSVIGRAVKDA